jgi:DNA repair protein RecN (Recombination protein N)
MLKALSITNIILIEEASIEFEKGLNVLSGETGAGKSAILKALSLILGEKSETHLIRKGAEKAIVEALFDISALPEVQQFLSEAGFSHDPDDDLVIRRELSANGKSRAFINHQIAQRPLLEQLGLHLIDHVGQHAHQSLLSLNTHRNVVDLFGGHSALREQFKTEWQHLKQLQQELDELTQNESRRLRDIESYTHELQELDEANLKPGEEEELYAEYKRLVNFEEIAAKLDEVLVILSGEGRAPLPAFYRCKNLIEKIAALDSSLQPTATSLHNIYVELQEHQYSLNQYRAHLDFDAQHLEKINTRLALLNSLKKRYGGTFEAIEFYRQQAREKLALLENADQHIEDLRKELEQSETHLQTIGKKLTAVRRHSAMQLQALILDHLRPLNMQRAGLEIRLSPAPRSDNGEDLIEFFFAPNVGEHLLSVRDCASGGELSRLLLALKTAIARLQNTPTLIFDEIDANIGGETATLVGQKLKAIACDRQVLCITHLPQIAHMADQHLYISKQELKGRTTSTVQKLSKALRKKELARMLGGKTFNEATSDLAEKVLETSS